MTLQEKLKAFVYEVEQYNIRLRGKSITQKLIAKKLGIGQNYLSNMLTGQQSVTEKIIDDFKVRFKTELEGISYETALLQVLLSEFAEQKANKQLTKEQIILDIESKANAILKDSHSK